MGKQRGWNKERICSESAVTRRVTDVSSYLSSFVSRILTCARIDSIQKLGRRRETSEEVYRKEVVS